MANNNECLGLTLLTGCLLYNGDTLFTEGCGLKICKGDYLNDILENIHEQMCTALSGCTIKVTEDDECCSYLQTKLISTDLSITFTVNTAEDEDGNSCQTLNAKVNFPVETLTWININPTAPFTVGGRFQYSKDSLGDVRIRGSLSCAPSLVSGTHSIGVLPSGFYSPVFTDITSVQRYTAVTPGFYTLYVDNTGTISAIFDASVTGPFTFGTNIQYNIT